jgi:hypothetical protein
MRRLLAVSWEMPPMYGPRGAQVARTLRALVLHGWQSTVVCLDPRRGGPNWRDGKDAQSVSGVDAVRVASPEEWTAVRALWRLLPALRDRPDPKWVWVKRAADAAEAAASRTRFDGLVTFAQPWSDHLVGLRVHRATKLPWVAHFSDPWIDSPYWRGSRRQRAIASAMEARVIHEATAVVFVTDEAAELVMRKYPRELRGKVAVVPHGFEARVTPATLKASPDKALRIVYTGRFYDGLRTPETLLRAVGKINAEQPLAGALDIAFVGPFVTGFERQARSLGVEGIVRFQDRVSSSDAQSIAALADVLLVVDAPTDGPSPFLPSKLVDYLAFRKPIFGITPHDGASASLLRRIGGMIAAPDDEAAMRIVVRDLLRRWREGELAVGADFDRLAAEYDIQRTTETFSGVLSRAFGEATPA